MTAKEIIEALEAMGVTRYRIEKDTGITRMTLGKWSKNAVKKPNVTMVNTLTDYYNSQINFRKKAPKR